MSKTFLDITMSLDGFITGPNPNPEEGLGRGGEALHAWAVELRSFNERHGREGEGKQSRDSDLLDEAFQRTGSWVMGRNMFDPIGGPWGETTQDGWWGDDPPFSGPVFVVTHHEREPLELGKTTFNFVTEGVEAAVTQAREASAGKDVSIAGGANVFQQALRAGLVDEFTIHIAPLLLGDGTRLFEDGGPPMEFQITQVLDSDAPVTHIRYEVKR